MEAEISTLGETICLSSVYPHDGSTCKKSVSFFQFLKGLFSGTMLIRGQAMAHKYTRGRDLNLCVLNMAWCNLTLRTALSIMSDSQTATSTPK
jgi:hypothetical protein